MNSQTLSATDIEGRIARLHLAYVEAVNMAVAEDDLARADELAASFDREVAELIAAA